MIGLFNKIKIWFTDLQWTIAIAEFSADLKAEDKRQAKRRNKYP